MLKFNVAQQPSGFTSVSQSLSNDKNSSNIIREILQNSYDSATEIENFTKAKIKFLIEFIDKDMIPGIENYEKAILGIKNEKLSQNSQEIDILNNIEKELSKDKFPVLFVVDNGVGFGKEKLESVLGDGTSNKNSSNASGLYGNGHFASFNASNLRYCLYGGKVKNGETFCSGQAILRTFHDENGDLRSSNGFLVTKEAVSIEAKNDIFYKGAEIPNLISEKLNSLKHSGGILCIVDFNFFGEDDENLAQILKEVVAKNFFSAIYKNLLEVEFVNFDGKTTKISKSNLDEIFNEISKEFNKKIEPGNAILFYDTLKSNQPDTLKMDRGGAYANIFIKENTDDTKIALCRNGMWITDRRIGGSFYKSNFADNKHFYALIEPLKDTEFANLIRLSEGHLHTDIQLTRIQNDEKRERLRGYLETIKKFLQQKIEKNENKPIGISIPEIQIQITGDTKSKKDGISMPKNPKITKIQPKPIFVEESKTADIINNNDTSSNNKNYRRVTSPVIMGNFSSSHNPSLNSSLINFTPEKNYSNLILKMRIDNGSDDSCDNITAENYMNLVSAKNIKTNTNYKIQKDTIFIGDLCENESVEFIVEFENDLSGNFVINYDFLEIKKEENEK